MKTILIAELCIVNRYGDRLYFPIRAEIIEPPPPTVEMKKWEEEHPNCREIA
jgi:hypothetical protein